MIELPWPSVHPNWLVYVRIAELNTTVDKARALGGRVLVRGERVAILQDPQGGAFAVALNAAKTGAAR